MQSVIFYLRRWVPMEVLVASSGISTEDRGKAILFFKWHTNINITEHGIKNGLFCRKYSYIIFTYFPNHPFLYYLYSIYPMSIPHMNVVWTLAHIAHQCFPTWDLEPNKISSLVSVCTFSEIEYYTRIQESPLNIILSRCTTSYVVTSDGDFFFSSFLRQRTICPNFTTSDPGVSIMRIYLLAATLSSSSSSCVLHYPIKTTFEHIYCTDGRR